MNLRVAPRSKDRLLDAANAEVLADIAGLEHEFGRALTKLADWARLHAQPNGH